MVPQCTVLKASVSVWLVKAALTQTHFLAAALLGHSSGEPLYKTPKSHAKTAKSSPNGRKKYLLRPKGASCVTEISNKQANRKMATMA